MNFLKRAWELVSPLVIYSLIQYVVVTAVIFVYIYTKADPGLMGDRSYLAEMARASYDMLDRNVVLISGISALFAILPLYRMLKKEWLKRPYLLRQTEPKTVKYIFVLAASAGMTISVNLFINALEVFKYASGYVQAAEEMYAEPLYMQVIVIGILMPVMEEIIFRGLMYERISNFSGEVSAMLLTSFVFGVYHGNLVQGVYAFVFSLLMIYVYKRTGSFASPVVFHMAGNMICLALNRMAPLSTMGYSVGIVISAMVGIYGLRELNRRNFFRVVPIDLEGMEDGDENFDSDEDVDSGDEIEKDWD